jgi:2-phosphoglycerate kinase
MPYPKVILVGGAPMSGKTSLAVKLAAKLEYTCCSTDDLAQAVRGVTNPTTHPGFYVMGDEDYREYYINRSLEQLILDTQYQHQSTWPAIEAVIRNHATWGTPIIIEGWGLLPEPLAKLNLPAVQSLFLLATEIVLEKRIRDEKDFHREASDEEKLIHQFLARSCWFNRYLQQTAAKWNLPILEQTETTTLDEIEQQALAVLQDR